MRPAGIRTHERNDAVDSNGHVELKDIERAAALVFRREGYRGSTMQQIADEVGLHKTSLYHHITSKESLLVSISQVAITASLAGLEQISKDADLTPTGKLRQAVRLQVRELTANTDQVAVFTMYLREISDDSIRQEFIDRRDRYGVLFQRLVADCLGEPEDSSHARMVSFGILGMCNWLLNWYHEGGEFAAESLAETYSEMAVNAVVR